MDETLGRFLGQLAACQDRDTERRAKWDECYKAYEAIYKPLASQNSGWNAAYHPPYVLQVIETIESFIVEGDPIFKVEPLTADSDASAPIMERLLKWQMGKDHFAEKQSAFVKQALICGISVAKVAWVDERKKIKRRQFLPVMGDYPVDGEPIEEEVPGRQQPTFIPVDVRDFWWDYSATCIEECERVFWRSYSTYDQLEAQGIYNDLALLKEGRGRGSIGTVMDGTNEKPDYRGKIEVIERWTPTRLTVVANRSVVIRDIPNPFWHQEIPFVVATTLPQPFKMVGKSEAEILADLQTMLWQFQNQRMDNVALINNAIVILNSSANDDEQYDFFPGAIWKNRNPSEVQMWTPNVNILGASTQTEGMIKQDLESMSAALPYLSGASTDGIDNKTATGISIVQNMAQKRMLRKKQEINFAYRRAGCQQIKLNQQLLPTAIRIRADKDNEMKWETISPASIQGDYDFAVEDVSESLNRQEKRAEALAKAQFFFSNYPVLAQAGVHVDLTKVVQDVTEAFDERPDKYLMAAPEVQQETPQTPPPPDGGPGFPGLPVPPNGAGGEIAPGTDQAGAIPPPNFAMAMNGNGNGGH